MILYIIILIFCFFYQPVNFRLALCNDSEAYRYPPWLCVAVLMVGGRFRVLCYTVSTHSYWCNFILVCIIVSSALLAAEDPLTPHSPRNKVP